MIYFISILVLIGAIMAFSFSGADRQILLSKAHKISIDGTDRTYRIYVPDGLNENPKIIFAFHGYGGDSRQMAYFSGLHNTTGNGTIVAYPDASKPTNKGQKTGWNAGFCCGSGYANKVDDIKYIDTLVSEISKKYGVQGNNIYATGFSNGGMFVNRLATELPNTFSGFASFSGSIGTESNRLQPKSSAAILLSHGELDKIVPYLGGPGGSDSSFKWLGFDQNKLAWEVANSASQPTGNSDPIKTVISYKNHKHPLKIITYKNNAHKWPDWRLFNFWHKETQGSKDAVTFFESL